MNLRPLPPENGSCTVTYCFNSIEPADARCKTQDPSQPIRTDSHNSRTHLLTVNERLLTAISGHSNRKSQGDASPLIPLHHTGQLGRDRSVQLTSLGINLNSNPISSLRSVGVRDDPDWLPAIAYTVQHTFGHRLRAAGVSFEDRQDLLGHKSERITTHYSAPELDQLLKAAHAICEKRPATVLRVVSEKSRAKVGQRVGQKDSARGSAR